MNADKNDREAAARERRRLRAAAAMTSVEPATLTEQHMAKVVRDYLTDPAELPDDAVPKFLRDSWRKMNG